MGYDLGDTVPITVSVRDAAGAPANAATVLLTIQLPDQTTITPTVTNPPATTGTYLYDYVPAVEGHYQWWLRTTAPALALTGSFDVEPSFSPLIVSLADARAQINPKSTVADEEIRDIIVAAGAMLEGPMFANHAIVRRTVTEARRVWSGCALFLYEQPVISVTSITRTDTAGSWSPSQLLVDTDIGAVTQLGGRPLYGNLTIVYQAGYTVIPPEFRMAARLVIADLWATQSSRYGRGNATSYTRSGGDLADQLAPTTVSRVQDLIGAPWLVGA